MSKILKLVGLASFTSPAFNDTVVKRNETIRVDDDLGNKLLDGKRPSIDENSAPVEYWLDVSDAGVKPTYDVATTKAAELVEDDKAAKVAAKTSAVKGTTATPAPQAATRRTSQRAS